MPDDAGIDSYAGMGSLKSRFRAVQLRDMQAGGDVSRIVTAGVGDLGGGRVLDQMRFIQRHADTFRRWLLNEPYGDPFMSIDLLVPPADPRAQVGYIIMEAMGYPLYSGSNTLCTATAILESGIISMQEGEQIITLEAPAGLVEVRASNRGGRVESVTASSEPAFVAERGLVARIEGYPPILFDLVWSGAYFAMVDATALGFSLGPDEMTALAVFGHQFVEAVRPSLTQHHPTLGEVGPLPFIHFMGPLETTSDGYRSPSATYVHPGVVCRSPTGTGTSARLALMQADGVIQNGQTLETCSPRGARFLGRLTGATSVAGRPAINSEITGKAWTVARSEVVLELTDPLVDCAGLETVLNREPAPDWHSGWPGSA